MKKRFIILSSLTMGMFLGACHQENTDTISEQVRPHTKRVPILGMNNQQAIAGQYIVALHDNIKTKALSAKGVGGLVASFGLDPKGVTIQQVYGNTIQGFAAKLSPQNLKKLSSDARVQFIEADAVVKLTATQSKASWGLDRIDQRNLPLNQKYSYGPRAENVTVYDIDTGIEIGHSEFEGRARWGINTTKDGINRDCHGHGTHVGGTIAGKNYGVAKGAKLVAVKVMDCDGKGSTSGIAKGLDWAAGDRKGPAVANMSLGGGPSPSLDRVVAKAVKSGLVVVVASGNENQGACDKSPARAPEAITVNSIGRNDKRSSFSNYGKCTDIFAPGSNIKSAGLRNRTSTMSGTSMATPHVAGGVAVILAKNPQWTPEQVAQKLYADSTKNKVKDSRSGNKNRLLYIDPNDKSAAPPPKQPDQPDPKPENPVYKGKISERSSNFQPSKTGFEWKGGSIKAELSGSAADLDLYLQKRVQGYWEDVAASIGFDSKESINYNAAAGTYRWDIYAYDGSGDYTLKQMNKAAR